MIHRIDNYTIHFVDPKDNIDTLINLAGTAIISSIGITSLSFFGVFVFKGKAAVWSVRAAMAQAGQTTCFWWTFESASGIAASFTTAAAKMAIVGKIAIGVLGLGITVLTIAGIAKIIVKAPQNV